MTNFPNISASMDIATQTYSVVYETRQPGAIGVFQETAFTVQAHSKNDAINKAREEAHRWKLETRFPVSVEVQP